MNKINSVADFLAKLKAKLVTPAPENQEPCPLARLKQMESRCKETEANLIDSVSRQKTTVREAAVRWSNNPDSYVRQQILKPHQMLGNSSNFEIDPMANLD